MAVGTRETESGDLRGSVRVRLLAVVLLLLASAMPAQAHVVTSVGWCLYPGSDLDALSWGSVNGHNATSWGAYAKTQAIANQGSTACGHASEFPAVILGVRWKSLRNGVACMQSSFLWSSGYQNTIAGGWQHPYNCGGAGNWADRACGALQGRIEKCPIETYVSHQLP